MNLESICFLLNFRLPHLATECPSCLGCSMGTSHSSEQTWTPHLDSPHILSSVLLFQPATSTSCPLTNHRTPFFPPSTALPSDQPSAFTSAQATIVFVAPPPPFIATASYLLCLLRTGLPTFPSFLLFQAGNPSKQENWIVALPYWRSLKNSPFALWINPNSFGSS